MASSAGRPTSWVYRMRKSTKGASLAVPQVVAQKIPAGAQFALAITADGLSYTYLGTTEVPAEDEEVELGWIKEEK